MLSRLHLLLIFRLFGMDHIIDEYIIDESKLCKRQMSTHHTSVREREF